ncbi:DGA1 [[Candida] subhashii]|uniref:diacylglycerol O-acyltransferase n=1 Tax=[Candida] subhashii TaxID=561895 RepID=A0A8J5URM6_9ASCO|nr:DGA1 [[Candida] subhashii]KAG7664772.1 DGA1 [[Candida] subhashii]
MSYDTTAANPMVDTIPPLAPHQQEEESREKSIEIISEKELTNSTPNSQHSNDTSKSPSLEAIQVKISKFCSDVDLENKKQSIVSSQDLSDNEESEEQSEEFVDSNLQETATTESVGEPVKKLTSNLNESGDDKFIFSSQIPTVIKSAASKHQEPDLIAKNSSYAHVVNTTTADPSIEEEEEDQELEESKEDKEPGSEEAEEEDTPKGIATEEMDQPETPKDQELKDVEAKLEEAHHELENAENKVKEALQELKEAHIKEVVPEEPKGKEESEEEPKDKSVTVVEQRDIKKDTTTDEISTVLRRRKQPEQPEQASKEVEVSQGDEIKSSTSEIEFTDANEPLPRSDYSTPVAEITNIDEISSIEEEPEQEPTTTKKPTENPTTKLKSTPLKKSTSRPFLHIAPLNTPWSHRLETIGIMWHCISIPFFLCLFFFSISMGWMVWLFIILPYFIWWYAFDLHTPTNGKVVYRVRPWMQNLIIWKWYTDYFPIRVHKSVELEPTFTYVLEEEKSTEGESKSSSSDEEENDEQDLISEDSRTFIDKVFKLIGLKKRVNDSDKGTAIAETKGPKYKKILTGPRYIFGYHPHGVISMGVVGMCATNVLRNEPFKPLFKFLKPLFHDPSKNEPLFPGIPQIFPLTLTTQFLVPFYRDYLLSLGLTTASAKNIKSLINNGDNSVCVVIGGVKESLLNYMVAENPRVGYGFTTSDLKAHEESEPEHEEHEEEKPKEPKKERKEVRLVLKNRKGFVKLAIELGNVSLVPTFAFGEADIYKLTVPTPGSLGEKFQLFIKSIFQFTVPFFSARGVFIYDYGILPYRNPINICTGRPIYIPPGALQDYLKEHPEEQEEIKKEEVKAEVKMEEKKEITKEHKEEGHHHHNFEADEQESKKFEEKFEKPIFFNALRPAALKSSIHTKIPQALLDKYHDLYVEELYRVFEENKEKYGYGNVDLRII